MAPGQQALTLAGKEACLGKKVGAGGLSGVRERLGGRCRGNNFLFRPWHEKWRC